MNEAMNWLNEALRIALFLPEQASTFATRVDYLHYFVIAVTMASSLLVGGLAVLFFFKYREQKMLASTPVVEPSVRFEAMVIIVPLMFFFAWVWIGFKDYVWYTTPPKNAMDVYVTGKKWMWHFAYPDGPNSNATLTIPAHRPVRLLMTSRDVIHSFFVPEFRIKQDVIPGRYTETWFEATKPGRYRIYCTEFCGTWHSEMVGYVEVLAPVEYDQWLLEQRRGLVGREDSSALTDASGQFRGDLSNYGRRLAGVHGCLKCHSVTGEPHIGPTWVDLFGRKTPLESGETLVADEAYLTESMMDPNAKVVKGYAQVMPTYRGKLSAPETAALVEFIRSLRTETLEGLPTQQPVFGPVPGK